MSDSVHVLSITSEALFDKMLQSFECVSWVRCLLKAAPVLYDNEMENNISLRIRQLFAVRHTERCRISWQLLYTEVCLGMTSVLTSAYAWRE